MDLASINPTVYKEWLDLKDAGEDYWQPSPEHDIDSLVKVAGGRLPSDYIDFLRKYSGIRANYLLELGHFPCRFHNRSVISWNGTLVPWASSTIKAARALWKPLISMENVGNRVPREMLPLTMDNMSTLLIDLRKESFGQVHYLPKLPQITFGSRGHGWNQIGHVANSFTDFIRELGTADQLRKRYPGWAFEPDLYQDTK